MNIETLVEKSKQNDDTAIRELMDLVAQKGKYIALSYTHKDEMKAEDILQHAYIKAFRSLDMLQDPQRFESWFYRILNRGGLDAMKVKWMDKRAHAFSEPDSEEMRFEDSIQAGSIEFQPKENFDYRELKQGIQEVMESLPLAQKQAVYMYYFEGLKITEIAEEFGVSESTVKSGIGYAK